jgi:RecA/RadA recombinase
MPRLSTLCPSLINEKELHALEQVLTPKSVENFLSTPVSKIAKSILDSSASLEAPLSIHSIEQIRRRILEKYACPIITAEQLINHRELLNLSGFSCGCNAIDDLLMGGIQPQQITEIYGTQASGKSIFCLSTALSVIERSTPATVLYIDSQNSFSENKIASLFEMRRLRWKRSQQLREQQRQNGMTDEDETEQTDQQFTSLMEALTKIRSVPVYDAFQLLEVFRMVLKEIRSENDLFYSSLRLIIIDSIGQLFISSSQTDVGDRMIADVIQQMRVLATEFGIAVLVTNLATQSIGQSNSTHPLHVLKPTLGEFWKSVPSARLLLHKYEQSLAVTGRMDTQPTEESQTENLEKQTVITRRAFLAKSSGKVERGTAEFKIDKFGISFVAMSSNNRE